MMILADGEKSYNCSEDSRFPSADNYLYFPDNIVTCSEGADMKIPKIPTLCACGCNDVVWGGKTYIHGHNTRNFSDEIWNRQIQSRIGLHRSEETKIKLSLQKLGDKNPMKRLEVRLKNATSRKGKTYGKRPKQSLALKGHHPWSRGVKRSDATRHKMSESRKGKLPAFMNDKKKFKEMCRERQKKFWKNEDYRERNLKRLLKRGKDHPNWKGGISFEPYCPKFNKELKEKIRERDNRTCQLCGVKENSKRLVVHHIHYDKPNCNPDLIVLCNKCNPKVNFNRDYYEGLFIDNLKRRGIV